MTAQELQQQLQSSHPPRLLDVREPWEHARAALPDSRLIPLGDLPLRVGELDDWSEDDIVVYCHHGIRSAHAIAFLRSQGWQRLQNLAGGIDAWSAEIDPQVPRY